ncbi:MAG: tetratricopeptide repeat protein [Chromatiales bacterium]|jgi:Flp pilus assembly protein TadD
MKISIKLLSVILLLQIVTGVVVFTITRAYYLDKAGSNPVALSDQQAGTADLTTDELILSLEEELRVQPASNNPAQINQQANEAFQQQNFERAAALYQRLVELSPEDASAYNNLGLTLHYLGRSDDALQILKMGSELQPSFQRIWLTLGFVNKGIGQNVAARQAFEQAIALGADTDPGRSAQEMLQELPQSTP